MGSRNEYDAKVRSGRSGILDFLNRISIRAKLWIGFSVVVVAIASMAFEEVSSLSAVHGQFEHVVSEVQPIVTHLERARSYLDSSIVDLGYYLHTRNAENLTRFREKLARGRKEIDLLEAGEENQNIEPARITSIHQHIDAYEAEASKVIAVSSDDAKNYPARHYATDHLYPYSQKIQQHIAEMIFSEQDEAPSRRRRQIATDVFNLRYTWSNIVNANRAFMAFRNKGALTQLDDYQARFYALLDRLDSYGDDLTFEESDAVAEIRKNADEYFKNFKQIVILHSGKQWRMDAYLLDTKLRPQLKAVYKDLNALIEIENTELDDSLEGVTSLYRFKIVQALIMALVFIGLASLINIIISRRIVADLGQAVDVAGKIAGGNLDNRIEVQSEDETGRLLSSLDAMQTQLRERIIREREKARENERIKQALDSAHTSVMVVSPDGKVLYANDALLNTLRKYQQTLSEQCSGFSPERLIGHSVSMLSCLSSLDVSRLRGLTGATTVDESLDGIDFRLTCMPVLDAAGQPIGTVVEWYDRTEEIRLEQALNEVVERASQGDLQARLNVGETESEFYQKLSASFNTLLEINERVIGDVSRVLGSVSAGRLTQKIHGAYQGAFEDLRRHVNDTVDKLREVIQKIDHSASGIHSNVTQIAEGNHHLEQRTQAQASDVESTAASMEEITGTIRQNGQNLDEARCLANKAKRQAEEGGQVVRETTRAMEGINNASAKITDITNVIDEIAFQTNLLALNAAVEAAHAGEQGKGFAVVAAEVRDLAQRSAEAAREINDLIEDTTERIREGSELVDVSGNHLDQIIASITSVSRHMDEIAAAGVEQAAGIEQINQAISRFDQSIQQNRSLAAKTSSTSAALLDESKQLSELVAYFKLADAGVSRDRRSASRPWRQAS